MAERKQSPNNPQSADFRASFGQQMAQSKRSIKGSDRSVTINVFGAATPVAFANSEAQIRRMARRI